MGDITIPASGGVTSELVWDEARHGTTTLPPDTQFTVGDDGGVPPSSLLAAAADAALMVAFLDAAARDGLTVLGYVSATRVGPADEGAPRTILLLPSVLVAAGEGERADALLHAAFHSTPLLACLGDAIQLEGDVEAVSRPGDVS